MWLQKCLTTKFFTPLFCSCFWIRDPGWVKIRIRDKHPGSATLVPGSTTWIELNLKFSLFIWIRHLLTFTVPILMQHSEKFFQYLCIRIRYLLMYKVPILMRCYKRLFQHWCFRIRYLLLYTVPTHLQRSDRFFQYLCIQIRYPLMYMVPTLPPHSEKFFKYLCFRNCYLLTIRYLSQCDVTKGSSIIYAPCTSSPVT